MTKTFRRSISFAVLALSLFVEPTPAQQDATAAPPPQPAEANDAQVQDAMLALEVKTALLDKIGWDATPIEVTAKTGTVWLTGKVKARSAIGTAEEIAKATPGVSAVRNVLELESSKGTMGRAVEHAQREVDDAVLESRVKHHLLAEIGKVAFSIEVEANGGVVSLSGRVPDELRHQLAVQTAGRVSGVSKVVDLITLP